jgi:SPP1 gp7 family putative phage head morphogenesis protein
MPKKQSHFKPSQAAETKFNRALRKVAKHSAHIVEMHMGGIDTPAGFSRMTKALEEYSSLIDPWARRQASKMLEQVAKANKRAYNKKSKVVGVELNLGVAHQSTGEVAAALMHEQVALIKSIPLEAGYRAQKLAQEAFFKGTRASEIAKSLQDTTSVTEARATLIARTEVARSNASFTQARAQAVGSDSYIWRTTMDGAERPSHRKMNGKTVLYARPPTLSDGTTGHAGTFPNCRCYQDVQFSD